MSSVQFRNEIMESQKRVSYQNEFDRFQGAKRLTQLNPNILKRRNYKKMQGNLWKATHTPYTQLNVKFNFIFNIYKWNLTTIVKTVRRKIW